MAYRAICLCILFSALTSTTRAGILSFSGRVYNEARVPVSGALVIPGTFAAGFDPFNYTNFYGDESQNLLPDAYDMAVADGNFDPAGAGVLTSSDGSFTWLGNPSVPPGQPLWFFVFESGTTNSFYQALASSNSPNWISPPVSGATMIAANEANQFVLGERYADGVATTVIPFPEPTSTAMALMSFAALASVRRFVS